MEATTTTDADGYIKTLEEMLNRTNILKIQDTEPFAAYLFNTNSQGVTGFFKKIKDKQKLPRIVISICDPDRASNQQISYLPSCLIGPWSCISILSLCRKLTAEDLLGRNSFDSTERILSPFLASMPHVLNELDLVDALRLSWSSVVKTLNADDIVRLYLVLIACFSTEMCVCNVCVLVL
ncbi:nephrocystin-1 [Trichonephila clavipes]|nr:nephrocystin-1 [Trichonephila clavipes]